jgi:NAD+ kinase
VEELFKSVGIVARYDKKQAMKLAEEMAKFLRKRNLDVYLEDTLAGKVGNQERTVPLKDMKTDFIITVGGDGTILRTCLTVPKPEPPMLAINMGVRGFLTEVEPKTAFVALEKCITGDYRIEKCVNLSANTNEGPVPDALNDVVVTTGEPSKILYTRILKDDKPILTCEADGIIVSTQTGSTGYSLSAGGPVVDPEVDAFILTPICSLTVFRSLIFPADSKVTIESIRPKKMLVLVDGNFRKPLASQKPSVTITRSKNVTSFIRFEEAFYLRLRNRVLFKGMG